MYREPCARLTKSMIQNFYLREVVVDKDGVWTTSITDTVYENHQDVYAKDCKL